MSDRPFPAPLPPAPPAPLSLHPVTPHPEQLPALWDLRAEAVPFDGPVPTKLLCALVAIASELDGVVKRGDSGDGGFKFKYATASDVFAEVRPVMAKHKVWVIPSFPVLGQDEVLNSKRVGTGSLMRVAMIATWFHAESGQTARQVIPSGGFDSAEKSWFKAITGALKYALLSMFLLPTDADPERLAPENHPASEEQLETIRRLGADAGLTDAQVEDRLRVMRSSSPTGEISRSLAARAVSRLEQQARESFDRRDRPAPQRRPAPPAPAAGDPPVASAPSEPAPSAPDPVEESPRPLPEFSPAHPMYWVRQMRVRAVTTLASKGCPDPEVEADPLVINYLRKLGVKIDARRSRLSVKFAEKVGLDTAVAKASWLAFSRDYPDPQRADEADAPAEEALESSSSG